jgi:hypothetical protein
MVIDAELVRFLVVVKSLCVLDVVDAKAYVLFLLLLQRQPDVITVGF